MASFMAKWSNKWPGQSGHIHLSLRDKKTGKPVFHDKDGGKHNMSETMRWFIGGQQALMPELLSMVACTVNSYSRLIPGFWAPTSATWGIENRTCALRAIPGGEKSQRVEYRIAAADINPYIAMAAALGSGLWGIENKIEPTAPVEGNAYEHTFPEKMSFPRTLTEAAERLRNSKVVKTLLLSSRRFHQWMAASIANALTIPMPISRQRLSARQRCKKHGRRPRLNNANPSCAKQPNIWFPRHKTSRSKSHGRWAAPSHNRRARSCAAFKNVPTS
jgi:glutamine synthetase